MKIWPWLQSPITFQKENDTLCISSTKIDDTDGRLALESGGLCSPLKIIRPVPFI